MSDPQGLAFDPVAADYDRGRPGWPEGVAGGVVARRALDLAAGTGKLTALLAERFEEVAAVEPSEGMLAVLRSRLPEVEAWRGVSEEREHLRTRLLELLPEKPYPLPLTARVYRTERP